MSDALDLKVVRDGALTRLELARPEVGNALSAGLVAALDDALSTASEDGTRLLVLVGQGRHFCTGFDLSALDAETDDTLLARFVRIELMLQRLAAAPFATLALASGRAMGAGADVFAACESRWIVGDASFSFPGAGFGLVLGTARLADRVGASTARRWVGGGERVGAAGALAAGLATARLAPDTLAQQLATHLAGLQRLDLVTHRAIRAASLPRGDEGQARDLRALVESAARPGLKARILRYRQASVG